MGRAPSAGGPRGFAARYLLDPTVHFVGGCLLTPPVFAALEPGGSSRALGYFSDPFLLGSLFLTGAAAWVTARSPDWYAPPPPSPPPRPSNFALPARLPSQTPAPVSAAAPGSERRWAVGAGALRQPLSLRDHRAAMWYLLNGTVIHILMDGLVGAFHVLPLMNENYEKLDLRFTRPWGDERGSCILTVSLMELFVKGPLCILLYHAYHTRKSYTDALELLVCALQLYGCIMFSGTELLHGLSNLPADWNLEFTKEHLLHFWFAFVACEPIWIVVPVWLGWRAFQRATEAAAATAPRKLRSSARKSKRT